MIEAIKEILENIRAGNIIREFLKAGADRYLLRIETTAPDLFKRLHPDDDLEYRTQCLYNLKKLGYEVGTGIRENYKLYDNKICVSEEYGKCAACTAGIALAAGKRIVKSKGYSKNR